MEHVAYVAGRIVMLAVAALVVLLVLAALINAGRTAYWLTQDHPVVAVALAAASLLIVGRKL